MNAKDTPFERKLTINCRGKLLDLSTPKIMGILNITPDSFYDGNKYNTQESITGHVRKMLNEGADIIDIGACSSRPGAADIPEKEELDRLCLVLDNLRKEFSDVIFSVDTFRSKIAKEVVNKYDVAMINDISAGEMDSSMFDIIAELKVPYVIMHMKGTPKNMQEHTGYENLLKEITEYFIEKTGILHDKGIKDIIIDPGIGFSKTIAQNYQLLSALSVFDIFELPVLIGVSRKSLIYKHLQITPEESLNGTTVLHTLALLHRVNILRVHDVKEARQTIDIMEKYRLEAGNIETE